jgi:hypothetical protein
MGNNLKKIKRTENGANEVDIKQVREETNK